MRKIHISDLEKVLSQHLSATCKPKMHHFLANLEADFGQNIPTWQLEEIISGVSKKIFGFDGQAIN